MSLLILFLKVKATTSLPVIDPFTSENYPAWKREVSDAGDLRTRQSIVWSCVATMFACTWIAIHPNLPDPRCSKWSRFKYRVAMMVLTVFAPEFILIWALRQRLGAQIIMKEYNSTILRTPVSQPKGGLLDSVRAWFRASPPPQERQRWTLTHGFYVQMGGFLFYDKATEWPIRVLSFPELVDLIKLGLIDPPIISEEDICDKSKGDFFAKLFVIFQTSWFMIQCIVRWSLKLPLTDIEVVTFSFAVLNIFMYALWFQKPQNVEVGTRIQMRDQSTGSQVRGGTGVVPNPMPEELDIVDMHAAGPHSASHDLERGNMRGTDHQPLSQVSEREDLMGNMPEDNHLPDQRPRLLFIPHRHPRPPTQKLVINALRILVRSLYILGRGILGAEFFKQLRQVVLGSTPTVKETRTSITTQTIKKQPSAGTTVVSVMSGPITVGTFHAYDAPESTGKNKLILFVVASGVLFGGLHLVPWKFAFPTKAESLIWRISALYMILNPILLSFPLTLFAILKYRSPVRSELRSAVIRGLRWITPPVRIITIAVPLYILARLSIIILTFTTLRDLPPDIYIDVPWNSYIPHI